MKKIINNQKKQKTKELCLCCNNPRNKYGECKEGCYRGCSDPSYHNGKSCDGSC